MVLVKTNVAGYFFDAFMDMEHQSDLKITTHPIQHGANVTDHAYLEPVTLVMKIKMSDVADDIVAGQFGSGYSRSVTAFQILQELQASRVPLTILTRLRKYDNMLIKSIVSPDDYMTRFGLEATITFQEILVAKSKTVKVSKRVQTTGSTDNGVISVTTVDESVANAIYNWVTSIFKGG